MVQKRRWTPKEIRILKCEYPICSSNELSKQLDRSAKAIRNKASSLELRALKRCYSFPKPIKSFDASSDLSYLIGAIKGDGYLYQNRYNTYIINLTAKDFEFVSQVREFLGNVIGRIPKIRSIRHVGPYTTSDFFAVQISEKSLFSLLNNSLESLEPYINSYPVEFLRGFFDAEGSAWINCRNEPVVKYSNTNRKLIKYVKELLVLLGIFPAPKIIEEYYVYIKKEKLERPKPLYSLCIYRKESVKKFMRVIGSSIPRKRLVL